MNEEQQFKEAKKIFIIVGLTCFLCGIAFGLMGGVYLL